jgi:hypothetical protein
MPKELSLALVQADPSYSLMNQALMWLGIDAVWACLTSRWSRSMPRYFGEAESVRRPMNSAR